MVNGRRKVAKNTSGMSMFFKMECMVLPAITLAYINGKKIIKLLAVNCTSALKTDCIAKTYILRGITNSSFHRNFVHRHLLGPHGRGKSVARPLPA
jgi:ABC-type antimicrobial peptide transport system permease subunit